MQLRFYAAGDSLVHERNPDGSSMPAVRGQHARYVGRSYDPATRGYPASSDPYVVDSDTCAGEVVYLKRCVADGDLVPADAATAAACGVSFARVVVKSGVAVPVSAPSEVS